MGEGGGGGGVWCGFMFRHLLTSTNKTLWLLLLLLRSLPTTTTGGGGGLGTLTTHMDTILLILSTLSFLTIVFRSQLFSCLFFPLPLFLPLSLFLVYYIDHLNKTKENAKRNL